MGVRSNDRKRHRYTTSNLVLKNQTQSCVINVETRDLRADPWTIPRTPYSQTRNLLTSYQTISLVFENTSYLQSSQVAMGRNFSRSAQCSTCSPCRIVGAKWRTDVYKKRP